MHYNAHRAPYVVVLRFGRLDVLFNGVGKGRCTQLYNSTTGVVFESTELGLENSVWAPKLDHLGLRLPCWCWSWCAP